MDTLERLAADLADGCADRDHNDQSRVIWNTLYNTNLTILRQHDFSQPDLTQPVLHPTRGEQIWFGLGYAVLSIILIGAAYLMGGAR